MAKKLSSMFGGAFQVDDGRELPKFFARIVAEKMSARWGQPVVVENRAGAGGNVAAELVAKSEPGAIATPTTPAVAPADGRRSRRATTPVAPAASSAFAGSSFGFSTNFATAKPSPSEPRAGAMRFGREPTRCCVGRACSTARRQSWRARNHRGRRRSAEIESPRPRAEMALKAQHRNVT